MSKDDDFLNVDDMSFLDEDKPNTPVTQPKDEQTKIEQEQKSDIKTEVKSGFPKLLSGSFPVDYINTVNKVLEYYSRLPTVDYIAMYKELEVLSVKSCPTPTLQVLNQELQRLQASKERLCEIQSNISQCHTYKKRGLDLLRDSWGNFSTEKSADKRSGDAAYRLCEFEMDFAEVDAALKVVTHISRNLDGLQENLSRRITIFQLQLKLHDMGRTGLPEFELKDDIDEEFGLPKSNFSESLDAETKSF